MKQEEIIEGNILIAKFDGWILGETEYYCAGVPERHPRWIKDKEELLTSDLLYHSSWDWLMPIVEKIESIYSDHHGYFGVYINSNSCSIYGTNLHLVIEPDSNYGDVYLSDPNAIFNSKIESTWYNIVEFIKWYNKEETK